MRSGCSGGRHIVGLSQQHRHSATTWRVVQKKRRPARRATVRAALWQPLACVAPGDQRSLVMKRSWVPLLAVMTQSLVSLETVPRPE